MSAKKSDKVTSPQKLAANRANARKSRGPKDTTRTRYNARKTGLFSDILTVTEEDLEAFQTLRAGVLADLQPEGELLSALADQIVVLHWRMRQAVGLAQHAVAEQVGEIEALGSASPPAARPGSRELSEARRLLEYVCDQAGRPAEHPPELMAESARVLGEKFTQALFHWSPPNLTAMWMCEEMFDKSRTWFHKEKPSELISDTPMMRDRSPDEVDAQAERHMEELRISHSSLCHEMQEKLLAIKREQLVQMAQQAEAEARWDELTAKKDRLERCNHYQSSLARQLERAELHYFRLRRLLLEHTTRSREA